MTERMGYADGENQEYALQRKERKTVLRAAVLTSFLTTFMGSALNLSIPNLEAAFGAGAARIGWVVTIYTLTVAALSVPLGKAADRKGRRQVFLTGIAGFAVATLLCAVSVHIWMLLLLRATQGVFAAMIFSTNNAILIGTWPESQRGRVLGYSTAATYVGLSLGPVIGGFLNHYLNWRALFLLTAAFSAAVFFIAVRGIPKKAEESEPLRFDGWGNLLYAASIAVSLYGLTNLSVLRYGWLILLLGICLGVVFVFVEHRQQEPVIRVSMFTEDAAFTLSNLAALLNYGATFAISYLMSIYLQMVMGFSSQTAGLILIVQPVMQAAFSPMMGRLSDRIAPYKLASIGMGFCTAGLAMFCCVGLATPLWFVILALLLSGFGFALFSSPNTNAVMACVAKEDYSIANSILATMRTIGHTSSMAVVTIVVGMRLGNAALDAAAPEDLVSTMHTAFLVFVGLCALGGLMSLKRGKTA